MATQRSRDTGSSSLRGVDLSPEPWDAYDVVMGNSRALIATLAAEGWSAKPERRAEQTATLMSALSEEFSSHGLRAVLVGGSAIEVWAPGAYVSDDTDVVVTGRPTGTPLPERAAAVLQSLGFVKHGLGWEMGPLYVHVVGYDVHDPTTEIVLGSLRFEAVTPEVLLADRMIGFKHWPNSTAYGQQAIALLAALGDNLDEEWLRGRLRRDSAEDVLDALRGPMANGEPITLGQLELLQERLRGVPPQR